MKYIRTHKPSIFFCNTGRSAPWNEAADDTFFHNKGVRCTKLDKLFIELNAVSSYVGMGLSVYRKMPLAASVHLKIGLCEYRDNLSGKQNN